MPDVTGQYDIRTVARLVNEQDLDNVPEEYVTEYDEIMDPEGNTIAYFVDTEVAELFCKVMNTLYQRAIYY